MANTAISQNSLSAMTAISGDTTKDDHSDYLPHEVVGLKNKVNELNTIVEGLVEENKDLKKKTSLGQVQKKELTVMGEYSILFAVLFVSICSALGFFSDTEYIGEAFTVFWSLTSVLLLGSIKTYLQNKIQARDTTIADLKETQKKTEIKLGVQTELNETLSQDLANARAQNMEVLRDVKALKVYIKNKDPDFDGTGFLKHTIPKPAPLGESPFPTED
jgi:hypothetical protein